MGVGVEKQGKWRMREEKGMGDFVGKMLPAEVLADPLGGVAFGTLSHDGERKTILLLTHLQGQLRG